jgi:hypothetical protein
LLNQRQILDFSLIFDHAKFVFLHFVESESDKFIARIQSIEVNQVKLGTIVVFTDQEMVAENHMVMEFFRNDPNGQNGVFQVLSNLDVFQSLKYS